MDSVDRVSWVPKVATLSTLSHLTRLGLRDPMTAGAVSAQQPHYGLHLVYTYTSQQFHS